MTHEYVLAPHPSHKFNLKLPKARPICLSTQREPRYLVVSAVHSSCSCPHKSLLVPDKCWILANLHSDPLQGFSVLYAVNCLGLRRLRNRSLSFRQIGFYCDCPSEYVLNRCICWFYWSAHCEYRFGCLFSPFYWAKIHGLEHLMGQPRSRRPIQGRKSAWLDTMVS